MSLHFNTLSKVLILFALLGPAAALAQGQGTDTARLRYPFLDRKQIEFKKPPAIYLPNPANIQRTVEFDPATKRYIIRENIGGQFYRQPQYLTIEEYQRLAGKQAERDYFKQLADQPVAAARQPGFIPPVQINSKSFEKIFGGNLIDIRPQGTADLTFSGQLNRNENPLFNERQRRQGNFDFNQRIQMNLVGQIGEKLKITTNYNTEAQFDFENQVKLDYTGRPDEIIQRIEAGNVNLPLSSTLITGTQALFGLKTQLQFGRLNVTSVFSQQKSQQKELLITNGSQQNEFRITADNYETNKHYFLAKYFRDTYSQSLRNLPTITSTVNITKIEVWVTNRNSSTADSRDVLALIDLGENQPYNTVQVQGGTGFSVLPAGFVSPGFAQQSNNLLQNLPASARQTNSNTIDTYFQAFGNTDNYAKLTYARKLTDREFTLNTRLGYISLNTALNADEVLAVAFRYSVNGVEYQVGEFSTDVPVDNGNPNVLYVKLLKNETIKTNLPTWDLMMKNIYSLGAYQISPTDFRMNIFRLDDNSGIEKPQITEGVNTSGKLWLQVTGVDNLNQQNDRKPDGFFDFIDGVTIDAMNGRITFPQVEPFGADLRAQFDPATEQALIDKYVYQPLYDSTRVIAQQLFPRLNRYLIKGTYQSQVGSEFQLNAINVPPGSVQVFAGTVPLQEGADFTVDYNSGRVRILNTALLQAGQPIRIKMENSELFGLQQRSLFGTRFDYRVNSRLNIGGTFMNLTEKPLTQKVNLGEEAISNTIWGVDMNYSSDSRWLTRMIDKIPFINTKEPSSITFSGEFANLIPGHPRALNFAGSRNGTSYIDDFEASRSLIDLKSAIAWQISGTPQMFPESALSNDLAYGYNRSMLAYYNIDPIFFNQSSTLTPGNIRNNRNELSNHYTRQVLEQEVFPFKQSTTGQTLVLPTLDLAYYPMQRGPYNYTTTGLNPDGSLASPQTRWGGMFRKLESTDFEALNIEFIELWILDPFIYKPNSSGGDMYFNLGNLSEDILKDGRKSLENGLPANGDAAQTDQTAWGRVPKLQPVIQAFDNNPDARKLQDVGIDGLNDADERSFFGNFLSQVTPVLNTGALAALQSDPSSDNYTYYRGPVLDELNAGILRRYQRYNGTEGNSKTSQQSLAEVGIENSASTSFPDGEDINRDNNSTRADEYYQYRVSIRPQDLQTVGQNYITDIVPTTVKLPNGRSETVRWIQMKIPIADYQQKVGNIQDFKSVRFIRTFMTNFADTAILRFAKMQLVRGEWRRYNAERNPAKVITDPALGVNPGLDNSDLEVTSVNIEENGKRTPIPYIMPPGIERERDFSNYRGDTRQNEQSLSVIVRNLRDGYGRAGFRTSFNDFRSYKRMEMFIHAEGDNLRNNDVSAFLRMGTDNQDNYYEYEIPLAITSPGTVDPNAIWPAQNKLDVELRLFQEAKTARNNATLGGAPWPINVPFKYSDGANTITVMGQPDMSKVKVYMLGIRNPYRNPANPGADDGLDKTAEVWFNELRLTDFDERGGWAATARLNAKLADFANVTISGSKSTIGFGSIERRVSERNRTDDMFFDISSSVELGKFFPERSGIKIPMFINYSSQLSTPQFDPRTPDLELKTALKNSNSAQRDSIRRNAEDLTTRRSINFTNVRKIKTDPSAKSRIWDVENFSLNYAFTEYNHRDFINESTIQKNYRAGLAYNFSTTPKQITPFAKLIKSNNLALIKDFNFSLLPSLLSFRVDVDRLYSENTLRNNDPNNFIPVRTNFNKNFLMTRLYGISWNLTKSMQVDFNATNYSIIDEPDGRVNGLVRDTIWNNLKRLGRTSDYNHTLSITYNLPINKLPGLDWVNVSASYGSNFFWKTEPLITLKDPGLDLGNTISNARSIKVNPTLSFSALYNKFGFIRRMNAPNSPGGFGKFMVNLLTSVRSVTGSYVRTEGTLLPGYLPKTNLFGQDFDQNAPGLGFAFGSQRDIRQRALEGGWITTDTLQNQLYITNFKDDLRLTGIIEPLSGLRIELSAIRGKSLNYFTNFRYLSASNSFENLNPVTTGDYTISYFTLRTAFKKQAADNTSQIFRQFEANRAIISQRLGAQNPNSAGGSGGFADGYSKSSQDVVIASFLAAYTGRDASTFSLDRFPKIPVPNWQLTYNGLTRYKFFGDLFSSFDVKHGYRSTYNVNGFNTLARYTELNGASSLRDALGDFLPRYQFGQVTLFEQFVPLLGIDMRFRSNMTVNFEYRKSRSLSLSLSNSQLANLTDDAIVFGMGLRTTKFRFPFRLFSNLKMSNDMDFKLDFALADRKMVIYRADVAAPEVSAGAKNISIRPSVNYLLNQRFNLKLFYDGTITKPYTSQTFNTSFSNFGVNLILTLQ